MQSCKTKTNTNTKIFPLQCIPIDIIYHIFLFLGINDICNVRFSHSYYYRIINKLSFFVAYFQKYFREKGLVLLSNQIKYIANASTDKQNNDFFNNYLNLEDYLEKLYTVSVINNVSFHVIKKEQAKNDLFIEWWHYYCKDLSFWQIFYIDKLTIDDAIAFYKRYFRICKADKRRYQFVLAASDKSLMVSYVPMWEKRTMRHFFLRLGESIMFPPSKIRVDMSDANGMSYMYSWTEVPNVSMQLLEEKKTEQDVTYIDCLRQSKYTYAKIVAITHI